jgi:hypothetical protein
MDFECELGAVLDACARENVPCALAGGIALAVHGQCDFASVLEIMILQKDEGTAAGLARHHGYVRIRPVGETRPSVEECWFLRDEEGEDVAALHFVLVAESYPPWQKRASYSWRERDISVIEENAARDVRYFPVANVDMSDEAVSRRIRRVSDLRRLTLSLAKATPKTKTPEPKPGRSR